MGAELADAVCDVLREAREAAGLSLSEVARRTGLNRQAIAFIERRQRRPTSESFANHALAVGLRPSEVWTRAEAKLSARKWREFEQPRSAR